MWLSAEHWASLVSTPMTGVASNVRMALVSKPSLSVASIPKRGGAWRRVTFDEAIDTPGPADQDILDLDAVLLKLAELDERMVRVVELRIFSGLTMEEVAGALDVSLRTAHNDWRVAKMWLANALEAEA